MSAFLAQVEPTQTAFGIIAEYGLLGAFCILLTVALVWAIRGWLKEKDARLVDRQAMSNAREKDNEALRTLTVELKQHSAQLNMDARSSQEGMAHALARQENAFDDLHRMVMGMQGDSAKILAQLEQLRNEQIRLNAQLAVKP